MKKKDTQDSVSKMKPKKKKVGKILGVRQTSKKKKVLVKEVTCPPKFCSSKVWRGRTKVSIASVIPAKAGIQMESINLDSRLHGNDKQEEIISVPSPFTKYLKRFSSVIKQTPPLIKLVAITLILLGTTGFIYVQTHKLNQTLVIKQTVTKQVTPVVAGGAPIQWVKFVKRSDVTSKHYLLTLPKGASDIKISVVTKDQADKVLKSPQKVLAFDQRVNLAMERSTSPSSGIARLNLINPIFSYVSSVSNFSNIKISNIKGAFSGIAEASDGTGDITVVDLSDQVASTTDTTTVATDTTASTTTDSSTDDTSNSTEVTSTATTTDTGGTSTSTDASSTTSTGTTTTSGDSTTTTSPTGGGAGDTASAGTSTTSSTSSTSTTSTKQTASTTENQVVQVTYTTPAPTITEQTTDTGKIVTVSASELGTLVCPTPTEASTTPDVSASSTDATTTATLTDETATSSDSASTTDASSTTPDSNPSPQCTVQQTHLTDVLASSHIPKVFKVGQESKIHIKWKNNGDQNVTFHAYDTDNDGYLDYVEWTVPHLSTQTFEIILISKAFQLDNNQNIISDVYPQVETLDNSFATIPQDNYVRVTFNDILDKTKDITITAKPSQTNTDSTQTHADIEIYPVYTDGNGNQNEGGKIATINGITSLNTYRTELTKLGTPTDTFDLKVVSSATVGVGSASVGVEIDYIVDPTAWLTGFAHRKLITVSNTNVGENLTNFPLLVSINNDPDLASAQANGNDIRFTDVGGRSTLFYEKENWTGGNGSAVSANFWVNVPLIAQATSTQIYVYYDNPTAGDGQNPTNVWDSSYAGVWHLNDAGNVTVKDSTSNANNGTNNGVTLAAGAGPFGANAGSFDGENSYIVIPLDMNHPGTVTVWEKWSSGNSAYLTDSDSRGMLMGRDLTGSDPNLDIYNGNVVQSSVGYTTNWDLIAGVFNGNSSALYRNGVVVASGDAGSLDLSSHLYIGTRYNLQFFFGGLISEVRISSTARSANWISFEYHNQADTGNDLTFANQENNITWLSGWNSRTKIIIDHTKVGSGTEDETNFPVLISLSGLSGINASGTDIRFTSSDGGTYLAREIESYSSSTGALTAWVKIPTLSHTKDTIIYMYTGNPSAVEPAADSANGSQNVWSNGYAGVWHLNDAGGSTIHDSTSNSNNGTNNGVTATSGPSGLGAGGFDGSLSGYVSLVSPSTLGLTNKMTVSGWVKTTGCPDYSGIIDSRGGSGKLNGLSTNANCQNVVGYFYGTSYGGGSQNNTNIPNNTWHYLVETYDNSSGLGLSYMIVDGNQAGGSYGDSGNINTAGVFNIGWDSADAPRHFEGLISDAKISTTARTAGWIATEYANQNSPTTFYITDLPETPNTNWLTGWQQRKKITISNTNVDENLTDFPMLVKFTNNTDLSGALSNGNDIRFTDAGGTTTLSYEKESWSGGGGNSATGIFWVKIPTVNHSTPTDIYVYYGNSGAVNGAAPTAVWSNGYAGVWHLNDAGNSTILDSTSNHNDGTNNGVTATSGPSGLGAGSFDTGKKITASDAILPSGNSPSTMSTWINTNSSGSYPTFMLYGTPGNIAYHESRGLTTNSGQFWPGDYAWDMTSGISVANGQWHHVDWTYDGSTWKTFVDGVAGNTAVHSTNTTLGYSLIFGCTGNVGSDSWTGSLSDTRISSIARSAAWIKFEYANQSSANNELTIEDQTNTTPGEIVWTNGTGNGSWNTAGNWQGNVVPGTNDIAVFNSSAVGDVNIDTNINVKGISIASGYTGVITQSGSYTMTLGSDGFSQAGGTFVGGSGAITDAGDFTLSGGIFSSTSGTFSLAGLYTRTGGTWSNPGTYSANFISTWDTTKTGTSNDHQITLPLYNGGTYDFTVDWGDGNTDHITHYDDSAVTHTYGASGVYTISIRGTINGWRFSNGGDKLKITNISQWGDLNLGNNRNYFLGTANLQITATDILNLAGTTNIAWAFGYTGIDTVPYMNEWDMSNVTDMNNMFNSATSFNQNIDGWNVSNVLDMSQLFYEAQAFNQPIGNWNVSNVANMSWMFGYDPAFNQPLSNWERTGSTVSNVTDMSSMFQNAETFNQNIGNWNVSKVTTMQNMFAYDFAFNNGGNSSINNWNTSNVTDMSGMFSHDYVFNQPLGNWERTGSTLANVTNMNGMFGDARVFNQNIGNWDVSNVTDMGAMLDDGIFNNGGNDSIKNWDVSNVTDMAYMFWNSSFNQPIGKWDVSKVIYMQATFGYTPFNQDISKWNTSNVITMRSLFVNDFSFNQNIGNWDTSKVVDMSYMFYSDYSNPAFNQNIGNWNVSNVTAMSQMFQGGTGFSPINYSNTLIGWSGRTLHNGVTLDAPQTKYYNVPAVTSARSSIISNFGWTINDAGSQAPAVFNDSASGSWSAGATWGNSGNIAGVDYPGQYDSATIDSNAVQLTGTTTVASLTVSNGGTLRLTGDETLTTPTLNTGATIEYIATSSTRDIKPWDYSNLTLKINGTGGTFTLPSDLIANNITLTAGTLNANNFNINLTGIWSSANGLTSNINTINFNGTSTLAVSSIATANAINFNDSSINLGTAVGLTTFNGGSYNNAGNIVGDAKFNTTYYNNGSSTALGGVFTLSSTSSWTGNITGTIFGSDNNPITSFIFNDNTANNTSLNTPTVTFNGGSHNNNQITASTTTFNGTSNNASSASVTGATIFTASSTNSGSVIGTADVYSPVARPLGGNVSGAITYHNYPALYFNDKDTGNGNWNDPNNWWTDVNFTQPAGHIPGLGDDVFVYSSIGTSTASSLNSALVSWWKGDITGGTTVTDSKGNNNGTIHGGVTQVAGKFGKAFSLNGTDGYVGVNNGFNEISGNNYNAVSFWFKANDFGQAVPFSNSAGNYYIQFNGYSGMYVQSGAIYRTYTLNSNLITGQWYNVIFVKNGTGNNGDLYINGVLQTSYSGTIDSTPISNGDLYFGKYSSGLFFNGSISDALVFNRALTTDEVSYLYDNNSTALSNPAAKTVTFVGSVTNQINISPTEGATFKDSSHNSGTITGDAVFLGENSSDVGGSVTGSVTRLYTTDASSTHNFFTEGGTSHWIIVAQNAVVNLSHAFYSLVTNVFKALGNGLFVTNSNIGGGTAVTPVITINQPLSATTTIKWIPSISWGNSTTCEYKIDGDTTYHALNCAQNGTDLPRPTSTSHSLFIRGTDSLGNVTEKSETFTYDNTTPIYTTCGTDLLDEPTRPFYYLQSDITADCHITTNNVELRGSYATSSTPGYKITGQIIANATTTGANGFNITLKNIIVTGTTTSSGADGNTNIKGGNGGTITVATSSTGIIISQGGDPQQNGGDGGLVTIQDSLALAENTPVIAKGGDSVGCGYGGSGGDVNLINSSNYVVVNNEGLSALGADACNPNGSHPHGGNQIVQGSYHAPGSNIGTPNNSSPSHGGSSVTSAYNPLAQSLTLPVQKLSPLKFQTLPIFGGTAKSSFSFLSPITNFLFTSTLQTFASQNLGGQALKDFLTAHGIGNDQSLAHLSVVPLSLTFPLPGGLFTLQTFASQNLGGRALKSYLSSDSKHKLIQLVTTTSDTKLTITLKGETSGTWNGKPITFKNGSVTITTPREGGRYYFTSPNASIPLLINVLPSTLNTVETKTGNLFSPVVNFFKNIFHF